MPTKRRIRYSSLRSDTSGTLQARLATAERAVQSHQRVITALHRIAALALHEQPLQTVLQEIVQEVSAATGFPIVAIEFYDEARQLMEFVAATGISPPPADQVGLRVPVSQTLSGLVARSGQVVIETHAQRRPEYADPLLRQLGVETFVCLPLSVAERVIGTLALAHPLAIAIDTYLVPLAESLANMIATLVARRQAEESSALDITARAQAEADLRVALTKYRTLFDAFPLGITVSDAMGQIVETNPMAEHLLGIGREEQRQRGIDGIEWRIVRPDGSPMPADEYASVRALKEQRVIENVEMGVVTSSKGTTWINVTAAPLPLEGYGVVITYGDITANRQAEEALRQLNATLEQRVAERTRDLTAANSQLQSEIVVREQAEHALRESEARFRRLADNAPDVIYRFDYLPERHFSYVSTAITAITGYSPDDYYADPDLGWRQLHADDRARYQRLLADPEAMRSSIEMRWMHRDGSVIWVEQRNVLLFDDAGHLVTVEGIVRDISERRRTSAALRESEERYRTLVEHMTQGVMVYQDRRVVFTNPAAARIAGCSVDDMLRCSLDDLLGLLHADDKERVTAYLNRPLPDTSYPERPFRFYRFADGNLRWVSTQSTTTTYNRQPAVLVVVSDVTDLKVTEERLRLSEARLHLLLSKTPAVIFSAWAQGDYRTTFISESVRDVLGYEPAQFMDGTTFWASRIHPEDKPSVFSDSAQLWQHGWRQYEYRCRHADGNYRWVETGVSLLPAVEGHPAEVIGYMINISERKQAEATLRHTNAELARAAQAKDEFLANMSHELRTPLNAIMAMSESLQEAIYGPLTDRQQAAIHHIETSGSHLLALINDILDLSKVETGRLSLEIERIVIADVCQASLLFVKELALKKSLRLSLDLNDSMALMDADPKRLKQMLVNLLANAVKFTPDGGRVSLSVNLDAAAGLVRFAVLDTGIGIAPEDLSRLFLPFSQLDSRLNRQHEGTGLGLALVRRLAELHGGNVTVESTVRVGSCFTITLPTGQPAPVVTTLGRKSVSSAGGSTRDDAVVAEAQPPAAVPPAGVRVLLVDDNEANILVIDEYLRAIGYAVAVARNGQEALDRVDEVKPTVILMDIQMPGMDGLEVIRRLRARAAYARTPIIALTALAMSGDRERCLEAGASAYLNKPVSLRQLEGLIQEVIGQPDSSTALQPSVGVSGCRGVGGAMVTLNRLS